MASRRLLTLSSLLARADDWIGYLKAQGWASATVRLEVSGASAFWTGLERRHPELKNPFRGTRERPAAKECAAPGCSFGGGTGGARCRSGSCAEAVLAVMARAGLRVGGAAMAFGPRERFTTISKGKEHGGRIPEETRKAIDRAGLPLRAPFAELTASKIADRFFYLARRLHAAGKLRARHSVHDLRHASAVAL